MKLLKSYISPWVLPYESILGEIVWEPTDTLYEILLNIPDNLSLSFFDVESWVEKTKNQIIIYVNKLEINGKFSFCGKFESIPDKEIYEINISTEFLDSNNAILAESILTTSIIRPLLSIEEVKPPTMKMEDDKVGLLLIIKVRSHGWADSLNIKPSIELDSKFVEIEYFKPRIPDEVNPLWSMNFSEYPASINVKRSGNISFKIAFEYEDRLKNNYKTDIYEIHFTVSQKTEIHIQNEVTAGDKTKKITIAPNLITDSGDN